MTWRPSGFRLGSMRERVTIQTPSNEIDSMGQPSRGWTPVFTDEPASWMPTAGIETVRGRSVEAGIAAIFTIHHQADITPEMRLVHSSGTYGIGYVKPVDGGKRYIELHCKTVVA